MTDPKPISVALSDEEVAERVAEIVGMGQYAWDMVPSKELAQAFRAVLAAERRWVPVSERVEDWRIVPLDYACESLELAGLHGLPEYKALKELHRRSLAALPAQPEV